MPKKLLPAVRVERREPVNLASVDRVLFEDSFSYSVGPLEMKRLSNVYVSALSIVYKNGRLLRETLADPRNLNYYRFRYLVKNLLTAKRVSLDRNSKHLLVTNEWSGGHYHWFTEVLPKLISIRDFSKDFVLLLPEVEYVKRIGVASLELLNIEFRGIIWMKPSEVYWISKLEYIPFSGSSGEINDALLQKLSVELRGSRPMGQKRYYISRAKALRRKVLNEDDLLALLSSYGYESVFCEDLTLTEQIDAFAGCRSLIGIHGAGLTNCIFMEPAGMVLELRKREPNYGYWNLADALNHRYYYFHGEPDTEESLIGDGCNLTIDLDRFEREFSLVLGDES